jgi:hypothetical protein
MTTMLGADDLKSWCAAKDHTPSPVDPEMYLRIRDYLLRTSVK